MNKSFVTTAIQSKHVNLLNADLASFRTRVCEQHRNGNCKDSDRCPHSHCQTWQRRNPNEYVYSSKLCPEIEFVKKGSKMVLIRRCSRGRGCMFAHSKEEELYHPNMYKTKMCNSHPHCTRFFCPFAHSAEELRKPLQVPASLAVASSAAMSSTTTNCWGSSNHKGKLGCPASPLSSSTTASSSTLTSPNVLAFSPISRTTRTPGGAAPGYPQFSGNLVLQRRDSAESVEILGLKPLSVTRHTPSTSQCTDMESDGSKCPSSASSEDKPRLSEEEARLYSEILVNVLQREGLTVEEKHALEKYKLSSGSSSIESQSTVATCGAFGSSESFDFYRSEGSFLGSEDFVHPPGLFFGNEDDSISSGSNEGLAHFSSSDIPRSNHYYRHENKTGHHNWGPADLFGRSNNSSNISSSHGGGCTCQHTIKSIQSNSGHPESYGAQQEQQLRISSIDRRQHYGELQMVESLCKGTHSAEQDSSTGPNQNNADPLLWLTALSLLDSTASTKTERIQSQQQPINKVNVPLNYEGNDTTDLLIAEVLRHFSDAPTVTVNDLVAAANGSTLSSAFASINGEVSGTTFSGSTPL